MMKGREKVKQKCVPMPTHCTITHFGFRARQIVGVKCGLFSNHAPLGETTLLVAVVSVWCIVGSSGYGDCMALLVKHQGGRQA